MKNSEIFKTSSTMQVPFGNQADDAASERRAGVAHRVGIEWRVDLVGWKKRRRRRGRHDRFYFFAVFHAAAAFFDQITQRRAERQLINSRAD